MSWSPSPTRSSALMLPMRCALAVGPVRISEVGDGEAAVKAMTGARPDILFINVKMPGISGAEAVVIARQESVQPLTVLMSDRVLSRWVALSKRTGPPMEFLKKPYDETHIAGLMQAVMRMRKPTRALLVEGSETTRALMRKLMPSVRVSIWISRKPIPACMPSKLMRRNGLRRRPD